MALIVLIALLACASAARPPQAAPLAALPPQAALSTGLNASAATSIPCTVKGCTKQGPPYSEECLNNTTLDCSHSVNNKCDACYIYRQDAFPFVNTFIFRVSASSTSPKHQLVVPTHPCRGIEDWDLASGQCGEAIWDAAAMARNQPINATGMAINPTNVRSQAQMHVHVAPVQPSLMKVLVDIAKKKDTKNWSFISCPSRQATNCVNAGATPTPIRVKYFAATGLLSSIAPFNTVYGPKPSTAKTLARAMLVAQPTTDGYMILEVDDRQVECLLKCGAECEKKCP